MTLATTLRRQDGLVTRRQALDSGLSPAAVEHLLRRSRWQVVIPGIYATFTGQLTATQRWMSGLLYGGPGCLLGGATAVRLYGLRQVPPSRAVHLLLPHHVHRSSRAFVRVRRSTAMPAPVHLDEWRVVPVARAVVDACRWMGQMDQVRALVAESVQQRKTTVAELYAELASGGSAGSAATRFALGEVAGGARSVAEAVARSLLIRSTLPPPEWNCDLFTVEGDWLARPDAWWREAGVVMEIDSQEWHLLPGHWAATMARHARMTSYGLLVVHITPRRLRTEPAEVLGLLARTIGQGMDRPTPAVTAVRPQVDR